jgi:hydroxymethylglutaryl-CoA lyase
MVETVHINEVGLRDGLQIQPRFVPTAGKLELCQALIDAGVREIEATSFVSPKAVPQMADAGELFPALPMRAGVHYSALVPNEKGYERARVAGADTVALVIATTETFNRRNINMSFAEALAVNQAVIARARTDGVHARAYISGAFVCPYEGVTPLARLLDLTERLLDAGADEIGIADTIGAGHPKQCQEIFSAVVRRWGAERFSAHFHDTRAMGLVLAWVALQEGIRKFDSSIGGLGGCPFAPGAAGNLATEDLVFMLEPSGYRTGIDVAGLRAAVVIAERLLGHPLGGRITPWWRAQAKKATAE